MGIERARVVEVHAADSEAGVTGSGYQLDDRLVLTCAGVVSRSDMTRVRAAGAAAWAPAAVAWHDDRDAAVLDVLDPSALLPSPAPVRWGDVTGARPVTVTAMAFPSLAGRPEWPRDPVRLAGRLTAEGALAEVGDGMSGALLFAGAETVGVVVGRQRAVPVRVLAGDPAFVELVGGGRRLAVVPVGAPAFGLPMLGR